MANDFVPGNRLEGVVLEVVGVLMRLGPDDDEGDGSLARAMAVFDADGEMEVVDVVALVDALTLPAMKRISHLFLCSHS